MKHLLNAMKSQAQQSTSQQAGTKLGTVSSYNPATYCVKVRLQPDDTETGWLPLGSPWVGNGWGMFSPPMPGDMVHVEFQEGHAETGVAVARLYSDADRPLPCPAGEFWLVHQSGSMLKFKNDGEVELVSAGTLKSSAPLWEHTGDFKVAGDITADGDIADQGGAKTMAGMRSIYNGHHHGTSPTPDASM
jgi:phage baseplate assembly protein gpV